MQRLASLKIISKITRNLTNPNSSLSKTNLSSTLHEPQLPYQNFTHYTTFSHAKNGNFAEPKLLFSNPFLAKQLLSRTLYLKGQSKALLGSAKAFYHSRTSFNSYGRGWRSFFQRFSADDVVLGLILSNVAVFMLWRVADTTFMMKNFMISVDNFKSGHIHTLITSAFSHKDLGHIISNMIGLYFFGTSIGRNFGPEYLLKLYLSGAVVGSIFFLVYHAFIASSTKGKEGWNRDPSKLAGLGASGAVNAIMLLDIFLFPKKTILLDFIIPVPAVLLGIFLIGKDTLRILEGDTRVSGPAHLGGAAAAAIAWARIRRGLF